MPEKRAIVAADVVKEHGSQLLGYIKSKISRFEDAEDVLQDVWYQLSRLTHIHELENISAWLYKVAKNKIIDYYRKGTNESLEDQVLSLEDEDSVIKNLLLLDNTNDPELALFKELFWKNLMIALEELPENQRYVFIANEIEGKTLQAIADEKQENIKTIISRKGYAVKHLRKRLQDLYNDLNQ